MIEFGAGVTHKDESQLLFDIAKDVFNSFLDIRRICSSALAVSYIGLGRMNGYFEKYIKPWDIAAATLVVEELGGKVCDWDGNPISYRETTSIVVGSPAVCEELLRIIKKYYHT